MRRRARDLLERLGRWNATRPAGRVVFSTQASIDLARDPELMALCVKANLLTAFVGIETPNEASLAETMKRQNLRVDLRDEVTKIVNAGIMVTCGMILGFDNDSPDIFERQRRFIDSLPVPLITLGLLVAPSATPLHARLQEEGRLVSHDRHGAGSFLETNIRPKGMSEAELQAGARWLINQIYAPESFKRRVSAFVAARPPPSHHAWQLQGFSGVVEAVGNQLASKGDSESDLVHFLTSLVLERPYLASNLRYILLFYCQVRYMLEFYGVWDARLAERDTPLAA
jgi:hypothetical protein